MFKSIEDIKKANANAGLHWFEPATLRYFGSRVSPTLYGGRYFITSEQRRFDGSPRRYSVRVASADGSIDTVGEFKAYATRADAIKEAKRLAAETT